MTPDYNCDGSDLNWELNALIPTELEDDELIQIYNGQRGTEQDANGGGWI
jgi:hypothetical protein